MRALKSSWKFLLDGVMIAIITGCIVACVVTVYVFNILSGDSAINLEDLKLSGTSIIYANDQSGAPYEVQRLHSTENRIWVDIDKIPQVLQNAAVAGEDKRFYSHDGVDWNRTIFALLNYFNPMRASTQGGSTITQQLIKTVTGDKNVRIDRKIKEIFSAINLTKKYSKQDVLEAYLNTIPLGNNTSGVEAGAQLYFGKHAADLDLAESAALVAITQNPSKYELFNKQENNKTRQNYILNEMRKLGMISQEEYDGAVAEQLNIAAKGAETVQPDEVQSYYVDNVMSEVIQDLMDQKGYTYSYASWLVTNGGLRIYTLMDPNVQKQLEAKFADDSTFPKVLKQTLDADGKVISTTDEQPSAAMVIINYQGEIVAVVGNRGVKTADRVWNNATQSKRQPGSSIKPVSVYAQAIEYDLITWSTIMKDSPITTVDAAGKPAKWPVNDNNAYLGAMTVDEAIQRSCNTIAVKVCQQLTPKVCYDFMYNKLGMKSLVGTAVDGKDDINLASMGLGALTNGITPLELTAAYQIFGNGGLFYAPHSYSAVLDGAGNVLLQNDNTPTRVISPETANVMNRMLQTVVYGSHGTGVRAKFAGIPSSVIPIAGKTGTSSDNVDQWFIGMTPYYVAGVWQGYDQRATIKYTGTGTGGTYPPPVIWRNVMEGIHKGLPAKQFPETANCVSVAYCTQTGLLATRNCPGTAIGYYKVTNLPKQCNVHRGAAPSSSASSSASEPNSSESSSNGSSSSSNYTYSASSSYYSYAAPSSASDSSSQ